MPSCGEKNDSPKICKNNQYRIGNLCFRIRWYRTILCKPDNAAFCVNATIEKLGYPDILIHCAGGRIGGSFLEIPQFTRDMARELSDYNIRVNCVAPGIIRTHFQDYLTLEKKKIILITVFRSTERVDPKMSPRLFHS